MTARRLWGYVASASALAWLLAMPAAADVAPARTRVTYEGQTSQGRVISFTLSRNRITKLMFEVRATCPSGRIWLITASNFPPIRVVHSRFHKLFASRHPRASARIRGKVERGEATGTLRVRRFITREHHFCTGTATFALRRGSAPPGRGHHDARPRPRSPSGLEP